MKERDTSIFRAAAVRGYLRARGEAVLPRFVAPRMLAGLWIVVGLLIAGGLVAWLVAMGRVNG